VVWQPPKVTVSLKGCLGPFSGSNNYLLLRNIGNIPGGKEARHFCFTGAVNWYLSLLVELN
jgi:hypothetical protein